jgi:hypothetical protein
VQQIYKLSCSCRSQLLLDVGCSAIPIGGSTIHRATGIGIPRRTVDFGKMWKKPNRRKWRSAKVWIIDEISMVSAEMLEYLEQTIRTIRTPKRNLPGEPFGGLQVYRFFPGTRSAACSRPELYITYQWIVSTGHICR